MASVLRTGLANLNPTGLLIGLCKGTSKCRNVVVTQVASISSREVRQDRPPRPAPFDWRRKDYNSFHWAFDPMEERFDENTKVVVVEGMPAIGKDKFAKELAYKLDMEYFPPPSFDDIWINPYGFDYRSLNHELPIDAQFFDLKSWLEDPKGRNTTATQTVMLWLRCKQYMEALCELLSSGNGVVVQRCPWTDSVFMKAMVQNEHLTKHCHEYYKTSTIKILPDLLKPHLIVYLDAPVSVVKDKIKKRNIPYEVNSKALTDKYLQDLATIYKDQYLREMTRHSHMLIYDWSTEGDVNIVVEDIERLDFDNIPETSEKFHDWKFDHFGLLKQKRWDYHHDKQSILLEINVARLDIPEMLRSAEDSLALENALAKIPSEDYAVGFNPKYDKGIWFKLNETYEDWLPRKNTKIEKQ